ncbi:MAG: hypothetical protein AB7S38_16710 [Vulcanimicrobiota bacterium]
MLGLIVILNGLGVAGLLVFFVYSLSKSSAMAFPSICALMGGLIEFLILVAFREFVMIFVDIETNTRVIVAHAEAGLGD